MDFSHFAEFAADLPLSVLQAADDATFIAANDMYANYLHRIFDKGENTAGAKIGNYGVYDYYAAEADFVRPSAFKSNNGKRGTPIKSYYTPEGWAGVRKVNGRQTAYIDFNYTTDLMRSIELIKASGGGFELAILNALNAAKSEGLDKMFSTTFEVSNKEEQTFYVQFENAFLKNLSKIID